MTIELDLMRKFGGIGKPLVSPRSKSLQKKLSSQTHPLSIQSNTSSLVADSVHALVVNPMALLPPSKKLPPKKGFAPHVFLDPTHERFCNFEVVVFVTSVSVDRVSLLFTASAFPGVCPAPAPLVILYTLQP